MTFKKLGNLAIASLAITGVLLGTVEEASARNGRKAALFGGLAAGAIIGGVIANQNRGYDNGGYYNQGYDQYPAYRPAYRSYSAYGYDDSYEAPVVVRQCYRERRAVYDNWGELVGYRRVKVCN